MKVLAKITVGLGMCALLGQGLFATAEEFLTLPKIRQALLVDYNFTSAEADRVINALAHAQGKHPVPIRSMIWTHGPSLSFGISSGYWRNLETSFVDEASGQVIHTNCLYDMHYKNGGIVSSFGYRWVLMFLSAPANAGQLTGAVFGRGVGVEWGRWLGVSRLKMPLSLGVQYLPGKNLDSSMFVVSPSIGVGGGIRFPKVEFVATKTCLR